MISRQTTVAALYVCISGLGTLAVMAAQEKRPQNIPFYTWVREDTFAGFIGGDMTRFEQGMRKAQEYLAEDPNDVSAANWLAAGKLYRAVRAYAEKDVARGDALFNEAVATMEKMVAAAPQDIGLRATMAGSLGYMGTRLPEAQYRIAMQKAREQYAVLYKMQEPQLAKFPLHLKGEVLAGMAETEFRVGDRERATAYLNRLVTDMPGTPYAQKASTWLQSPDSVTRSSRLVCQSCHEAGTFGAWQKRQTGG